MARLDLTTRKRLAQRLRARLPGHWRVTAGTVGDAAIELDQDGRKPDYENPRVGSVVINVRNGPKRDVVAKLYQRVPHPPGYVEGRKLVDLVARERGRGWEDRLVEAVVAEAVAKDVEHLYGSKEPGQA